MASRPYLKKTPKINNQKITRANRQFFLKWLPFNFCDRFCERCEEFQNDCKIYLDDLNFKVRCQRERKDPYDMKVVLEHVGEIMAQTMRMLLATMEKEGIKLTKKDEERYMEEEDVARVAVESHPLYKKCRGFSKELVKLLDNFPILLVDEQMLTYLQSELAELCFYCHLVLVKADRALHSQIEEKGRVIKFSRPDSLVSAALGYYSLATCRRSLEVILNLIGEKGKLSDEINKVLEISRGAKNEFEKIFLAARNFRNKIIFHGRL